MFGYGFKFGFGVGGLSTYKPSITYQWSDNIFKYQTLQEDSLGVELVTNGTFDTDSNWIKRGTSTISSGVYNASGLSAYGWATYQTISSIKTGVKYKVTFEIVSRTAGALQPRLRGGVGTTVSSVGVHTQYIVAGSLDTISGLLAWSSSAFEGVIDNISVKEVLASEGDTILDNRGTTGTTNDALVYSGRAVELGATNTLDIPIHNNGGTGSFLTYYDVDNKEMVTLGNSVDGADSRTEELVVNGGFDSDTYWTKGTGWSIANGVASCDGTQTTWTTLAQTSLPDYGVVQIRFTISNYQSGLVYANAGNADPGISHSANGTYTEYRTISGDNTFSMKANYEFIGSIDNISVKEILPISTTYQFLDKTVNNIYTHTQPWSDADWNAINNNPNLLGELAINRSSDALSYTRQVGDAWYPCSENSGKYVVDGIAGYGASNADVTSWVPQTSGTGNSITTTGITGEYNIIGAATTNATYHPRIVAYNTNYVDGELWLMKATVTVNSGDIYVKGLEVINGTGLTIGETLSAGTTKEYYHISNKWDSFNSLTFNGTIETTYNVTARLEMFKLSATEIANYTSTVRTNADYLTQGLQTTAFETDALGVIQSYTPEKLVFNGDGRYVDTKWIPSADKDWSIEAVFYHDSTSTEERYSGKHDTTTSSRAYFGTRLNGDIQYGVGSVSYFTPYETGLVHIVVSRNADSGDVEFYADSVLRQSVTPTFVESPEKFTLGGINNQTGVKKFFNTPLNLFKVHNKALTADEVTQAYADAQTLIPELGA